MSSQDEGFPANTPLGSINLSSPLQLRDWNAGFMLSTPVRPTPSRHTPSKTNWKLGAPQRTPQAKTPATARKPLFSTRRVVQGAAAASTPSQSTQRLVSKSRATDLIAPSLGNLPNALSAEYWLNKIRVQEQHGHHQAAIDLFELAIKRDVRPATTISREYAEFLKRHKPAGRPTPAAPASAHRTPGRARTRFADSIDQENHNAQNIISPTKATATSTKSKASHQQARRQSHVHFPTPEANVVSEAADPDRDERNNSSRAGSTPFQNKSLRRVTFADEDSSTAQTSEAQTSDNAAQAPGTSAVIPRNLDSDALEVQSATVQPIQSTNLHQLDVLGHSDIEADAAAATGSEDRSDDDDDDEDASSSAGSLSASAGSTPYINKSQLSAAMQLIDYAEPDSAGNACDSEEHLDDSSLSNMMERLLSTELSELDLADIPDPDSEASARHQLSNTKDASPSERDRLGNLLSSAPSPSTGAIHLTPAAFPRTNLAVPGTSATPADSTAASASSTEAMTPLCFDLNSLQLSAAAKQSGRPAMAVHFHEGLSDAPDLLRPESSVDSTPALTAEQRGWDKSQLETPGQFMSPELLGWYEQQGFQSALSRDGTPTASPKDDESQQQLPSFQFMRAPASAVRSKQAVDSPGLGKAVRVKTPANHSRVGRNELKGLVGHSPPKVKQDMGSIALLSPVRADGRLTQQLGAAKVVTPVRRSARKSLATPLIASMLREAEFAYAPNEALTQPRHPMFDLPAAASSLDDAQPQDADASTPSSVTGVSLSGDLSIPAEFPGLQAEASTATYSSSRLSSQSQSPLLQTPPDASTLLEAALSPSSGAAQSPVYGALHHLHAASSLSSDTEEVAVSQLQDVTNSDTLSQFATPPPMTQSKMSPQGPTTRSKSARKGLPIASARITASTTKQRQAVDSPSLSPTEAKIRDGLRRSARLQKDARSFAS